MRPLDDIVGKIQVKIDALVAKNRRFESENRRLADEKVRLIEEKEKLNEKILSLENRIKVLELSKGLSDVYGGSKEASKKVRKILREIDKCIALVSYK